MKKPKLPCCAEPDDLAFVLYNRLSPMLVGISSLVSGGQRFGSGFFIAPGGYIVTNAHIIASPASSSDPVTAVPPPEVLSVIFASRILVGVYDLARTGSVFTTTTMNRVNLVYEATLVGLDPVSDIAVIRIDPGLPWNQGLPSVNSLGHFRWGDSLHYGKGKRMFVLGNPRDIQRTISEGVVRDNNLAQAQIPEFVLTDADITPGNSGGPMVDVDGRVIGLASVFADPATEYSGGPSQRFMQPVVEALIQANQTGPVPHAQPSQDINGRRALRYIKTSILAEIDYYDYKAAMLLTLTVNFEPPKEMTGALIIDSVNPEIEEGWILEAMNGIRIGDIDPDTGLSVILWRHLPGDIVTISYRSPEDQYQTVRRKQITLLPFPIALDVPPGPMAAHSEKRKVRSSLALPVGSSIEE